MGWTSTGDPYANVGDSALAFDSEEAAKSFAERHGWDYKVRCFLLQFFSRRIQSTEKFTSNSLQVKKPNTPLLKVSNYLLANATVMTNVLYSYEAFKSKLEIHRNLYMLIDRIF